MSNEKDFVEQFSTTTVSTVAIQAGESRIVVAVLKCGELVNLQLSEAVPNLLDIGNNLEESKKLLEDHELLLSKLKSLEDQVWDLLCEADKTADENKDQERVYDAMASTLKDAWDTLIAVLEKRRILLHLAADFFRIALEFSTSIDRAEDFLRNTSGQESTDNITECFNQHQSHTKALLERSLHLLNKSHELTEFIDLFKSNQSIAYCQIARGARVSCSKIDNLLEFLQDRRRQLDKQFKQLRSRLEQTLQVSQWNQEEDKVTSWLKKHIEVYLKTDVLGSSLTENDELLHKHKQFVLNAKEWIPVIEKLKREAARLVAMVDCTEKENILTSNDKLNALHAEFWKLVDQRQNILQEANNFFKSVNKAFDKLGNIEMHLKHLRTEEPGTAGGEVETEIRKCTAEAFQKGQDLINKCSNSSGMTGIQEMIGYLQKRVDQLTGQRHTSTEYNVKKHSLLTSLEEHLRKVSMLIQKINSELERYSDPGCTINECEEVLNKLVELSNLTKEASQNMEAAAQLLKEVTQNAPSEANAFITNAHFLDEKLNILDQTIEEKLEVLNVYTTFLKSSKELNSHIQSLKKMYTSNPEERSMSIEDSADAQLQRVVNEFFSVRDMGQNCLNIIKMMSKNTVLKESHVQTVESTMDNLIKEKAELAIFLSGRQQHSNQMKASKQQWKTIEEQLRSASNKLQELENDLQPFSLLCLGDNLQNILNAQEKLNSIKDTFQKLNTETEHAVKMSELLNREQTTVMDASGKINDLAQHYQRLNGSIIEYEALLIKIGTFYKFKTELEILVRSTQEPPKPPEVNNDVQLHKTIEQQTHITSLYNLIFNLGTEIISTAQCSKYITIPIKDFQQQLHLLENERRDQDFKRNKQEEKALTNPNFGEALHDVKELNESFKDVKKKFNNLKFNYSKKADKGRNLKLIKNQIQQVEMYAEKMQVLKKKIDHLEKKTFTGVVSQQVDKADVFKEAICDLLKKVNDFNFVVEEYKQNLEMAEDLQHIMEECQFWSEEACATVVRVGRYSAECKTVEAIEVLLKQFNKFVEPTVPQQEERIQQMTNIARHIYGPDEGMKYIEKTITKHKESIHSVNDLYIYLKELEEKLQEPCKMLETPTNPASEELSPQPVELPSSAKDGSMLTDMELRPESLAEEAVSGDEYECISPDDISLPPLAETPESNLPQSETEQEEQPSYSSHSMHVSSYSMHMQTNSSSKRVTDAGSDIVTPIAYTDTSHIKRERTSSFAERFYSPTVSYKIESPSALLSTVGNETRYLLNTSPAKSKPNYSMSNQVHETHMQHHSVYTSMEKTEQLHVPSNTSNPKDRLHATPDEFSSLVFQSDPAKSCQRHMVTQEAIKSVSEKHSSVNVAGQTSGFSKPLPNITVKEGSPVTLEVEVTSCPEPTLTWFQKEHKHSTDFGEESKNTLVIREVCKKDPDQYIAHTSVCRNSFSSIDGIRWEDDRSPLSEIDWITLLFVYLCISLTYWLFTN